MISPLIFAFDIPQRIHTWDENTTMISVAFPRLKDHIRIINACFQDRSGERGHLIGALYIIECVPLHEIQSFLLIMKAIIEHRFGSFEDVYNTLVALKQMLYLKKQVLYTQYGSYHNLKDVLTNLKSY